MAPLNAGRRPALLNWRRPWSSTSRPTAPAPAQRREPAHDRSPGRGPTGRTVVAVVVGLHGEPRGAARRRRQWLTCCGPPPAPATVKRTVGQGATRSASGTPSRSPGPRRAARPGHQRTVDCGQPVPEPMRAERHHGQRRRSVHLRGPPTDRAALTPVSRGRRACTRSLERCCIRRSPSSASSRCRYRLERLVLLRFELPRYPVSSVPLVHSTSSAKWAASRTPASTQVDEQAVQHEYCPAAHRGGRTRRLCTLGPERAACGVVVVRGDLVASCPLYL